MSGSKISDEIADLICSTIEAGNTSANACAMAGIGHATFARWLRYGNLGREPYVEFAKRVMKARAKAEGVAVEALRSTMMDPRNRDNWRAATEFLQRSNPDSWAKSRTLHIKVQQEIQDMLLDVKPRMTESAYRELIAALAIVQDVTEHTRITDGTAEGQEEAETGE